MRLFSISIFSFFINSLYSQSFSDSILYSDDNVVLAYVLKNHEYLEYRWYNYEGFYCLSLRQNTNGKFYKVEQNYLNSNAKRVNPDLDRVFQTDTFAIGFLNRLRKASGDNFVDKFLNTVDYYYSSKDYTKDQRLSGYIDSVIIKNDLCIDHFPKEEESVSEVFFWIPVKTPLISHIDMAKFNYVILKGVRISKRKKQKINNMIDFLLETDEIGMVERIERITDINRKTNLKIDLNLRDLKTYKISPGPARGPLKLKSAFYIEL